MQEAEKPVSWPSHPLFLRSFIKGLRLIVHKD
jgi:hypothetical protein